jgi:hypothetical protein
LVRARRARLARSGGSLGREFPKWTPLAIGNAEATVEEARLTLFARRLKVLILMQTRTALRANALA